MSDLEVSDNELDNELSDEENFDDNESVDKSEQKKFNIKSVNKQTLNSNLGDDDDDVDDDDDDDVDEEEFDETMQLNSSTENNNNNKESIFKIENTIELPTTYEKNDSDYESDDDESDDDEYLQKLDNELKDNFILDNHPESQYQNYDEINKLSKVARDKNNIIIDDLHKTNPILTKYEKTRILGIRAKQINNGAKPYIKTETNIIDGYLIAVKELEEKKLPFIIRRPMPNGGSEFWKLKDLEII
jgi:DNA-directed RNA polymerase I, II, and III subunit RPABC2